jgi:hypothetical protein
MQESSYLGNIILVSTMIWNGIDPNNKSGIW